MKNALNFILIFSILLTGCNSLENNQDQNVIEVKTFEDEIISCELIILETLENKVITELKITNKSQSRISIKMNDFVFKSGVFKAKIPKARITKNWKIPNYEELNESEQIMARKEMMNSNKQNLINQMIWHSEISINSIESVNKEIILEFNNEVSIEELEFFFNGVYKKLLTS